MTQWKVCREIVGGILPMWCVRRIDTGELDLHVYGVQSDAIARMYELISNEEAEKEKAPDAAVTAQGAEK